MGGAAARVLCYLVMFLDVLVLLGPVTEYRSPRTTNPAMEAGAGLLGGVVLGVAV